MAGKGPLPKPENRSANTTRARRRAENMKVVTAEPVAQPPLPDLMPNGEEWPERTHEWWAMWREDPLAAEFRAVDWSELMDTAAIHGAFWTGNQRLAGELRLRTARHGATAEDRARLRIQYAAAEEADEKRAPRKVNPRYQNLRAVDTSGN